MGFLTYLMAETKFINNAARILKLAQAGTPADQALRESLTQNRHYTAPLERREISRAVFTYYRWWRWLDPKDSLQKQLEAALVLRDRFEKSPAGIKAEALAARAVPDWAKTGMDAVPVDWLRQLQREPALWIRPKQGFEDQVAAALGNCTRATLPKLSTLSSQLSSFRYSGITDLYRTKEFQAGHFEIQDLASQLVSHACAPRPGETWWDACAGEGGKTMHLSDLMQNKGLLWASDRSARRLAKLKERAARAQAFNFRAASWEGGAQLPTKTRFDGVLVDAPCSGLGTWQRNPHARWTTLPLDVSELAVVQRQLLNHVAPALKPGGRLVYAVCTLTRTETTAVADAFTAAHPEFEPDPVLGQTPQLTLWPQDLNANGMFIAAWKRKN
jgi:16S rRNA (cytosine967-C5)-methyltransferase